jgi:TonB family protein
MHVGKWVLLAALAAGGTAAAAADSTDRAAEANRAFVAYPKASFEHGEQGTVSYRVKIDRRGLASDCEVTQSSGFERLDVATCEMLMSRARFTPSRDSRGKATRSTYEGKVIWKIA